MTLYEENKEFADAVDMMPIIFAVIGHFAEWSENDIDEIYDYANNAVSDIKQKVGEP